MKAVSASSSFGFCHGCGGGAAIGKRSVQGPEINAGRARVPINHTGILKVLARDKVRCKERCV